MSSSSQISLVLSKTRERTAIQLLANAIEWLLKHYDFGFRGYGGILALDFEGKEFLQERRLTDSVTSAADLGGAELERLARRERGFIVGGSIRIPGVEHLIDLEAILYPTFDPAGPVCVLFRIDRELYASVDGDGEHTFDPEAASRLLTLCVGLGAQEQAEGFQAVFIHALDQVHPFDGAELRRALMDPRSIRDLMEDRGGMRPGFVTGIKKSVLGTVDLTQLWSGYQIIETTNGFVLVNELVG